jgi:hypothetical protein
MLQSASQSFLTYFISRVRKIPYTRRELMVTEEAAVVVVVVMVGMLVMVVMAVMVW